MKPLRFFFRFTKDQQKGIMALFLLIIIVQALYFIFTSIDFTSDKEKSVQEKEWLAYQDEINSLKVNKGLRKDTIYPFNPNYISDYKGYQLGLTTKQIDLLHAYRKSGKYINTVSDFQRVTNIHDTLLVKLSPYFKFGNNFNQYKAVKTEKQNSNAVADVKAESNFIIKDINQAFENDLIKVYGVGPYYAKVILRQRNLFGGFVSMDQIYDFTELSAEAKKGIIKQFGIINEPEIDKINVNTASLLQLSRFPYFNRDIAKSIITERSMKGKLMKIDDLLKISGFPVDKEKIIALYLEF